ncbi:MAG: cell wall-binding repeat-containing protein [Coriobacteriia bacterium]
MALSAPGIALAGDSLKLPTAMTPLAVSFLANDPVAIPVQGANRYLTAVEASKKFSSAATVVVASGEAFPDALGGAALAGAVDGPLLLTPASAVPADVLAEISRLGATKVYVLGGTSAVSAAAFSQLDAAVGTVVRLGGTTRYQTAQLIADETISVLGDSYDGGAFLATGQDFPDALGASPVMYAQGMPLVIVNAAGAYTLPAEATDVVILGGTGAVPASVQTALGATFETRIAGSNRYATAAAVAQYGVSLGMSWNNVGVATGENFPDALCAGPLVGSKNAVLLLTTSATLSSNASSALGAHKAEIAQYYLFGGVGSLSAAVRSQIATVLEGAPVWNGHALPEVSCTASGCHDTELATIHIAKGCYMCHGMGATPSNDCIACHGETVHDAVAIHADITSDPATPAESCTQAACHGDAGAMALHTGGCAECHASSREAVEDAISNGDATCESCHTFATVHVQGDAAHAVSGDCFTSTCHGTDVARMHTIDFRGTGDMPPGCAACHGEGVTPSLTCTECHINLAAKHDEDTAHATLEAGISGDISGGCVTCHGSDLMDVAEGEHVGCTCHAHAEARGKTECQSCHTDPIDPNAENPYHVGVHDATQTMMETNSAGCVSCHGSNLMAVLPAGNPITGVSEHNGCTCHQSGEAEGQTACEDCHVQPMDPAAPYPYHVDVHDTLEAGIAGTTSPACVSCHGSSIPDVGSVSLHVSGAHAGCSCHAYGEATPDKTECANCHEGAYAPHGFVNGHTHTGEGWVPASGHNTTTYGVIGAKTKFDGSQGVTLMWESEIESASLNATWLVEAGFQPATRPAGITSVTIGQEGVVSTDWDFPTANVFWQAGDTAAPSDAMFLNKDSVITCEDCHAGLSAAGPHGADDNWGLDPDYPAKYSYAELTKDVESYPSGIRMRSTLTTVTQSYTSGMGMICSKCHDLQNYQSGTTVNNPLPRTSTGDATFDHNGETYDPVYLDQSGTRNDGYFVWTDNAGDMVPLSDIVISGAVGSQTWTSSNPEAQGWTQGAAGTKTAGTIGSSNTAHSSHHQDTNDGSAQCVGCHIGVPHGWKSPRLLVNSGWNGAPNSIGAGVIAGASAPYRSPDLLGTTRNNGSIPMNPVTGYNDMGMLTLSAVDNHNLWAGAGVASPYNTGAAYWSEPSCQACNDHAGEDGIRIIDSE